MKYISVTLFNSRDRVANGLAKFSYDFSQGWEARRDLAAQNGISTTWPLKESGGPSRVVRGSGDVWVGPTS